MRRFLRRRFSLPLSHHRAENALGSLAATPARRARGVIATRTEVAGEEGGPIGRSESIESTYSVNFSLVVPDVYVIVQQRLVDGNASLRVDHEHARQ